MARRGWARHGTDIMPRKRQPRDIWHKTTRPAVWQRDKGRCQGPYCQDLSEWSLALEVGHIDHIKSGKLGSNHISNLRLLCPRCHSLRLDTRHSSIRSKALSDGIIPADFRPLLWDG